MADSSIRWEDPPEIKGGPGSTVWIDRLRPLMAQPKRWAVVAEPETAQRAGSMQSNLASGRTRKPPGRWQFAARSNPPRVYARYLGPDDDGDGS